jgi:hypothetical protein
MKFSTALFASMMSMVTPSQATEAAIEALADLQWKHRVLLVFAREPATSMALSNLNELAPDIEERDIAWILIAGENIYSNFPGPVSDGLRTQVLGRYFAPRPEQSRVVLIGKDGGVKSQGPDLDLVATFGLIDQMPMRKAELRRDN